MSDEIFQFAIRKENDQDIKIEGEITSGNPINMSSRMFIAKETIPQFITILNTITPEMIAENSHKPIKNNFDDIGFAIESFEYGEILTIANDHVKADGTIDKYGLLDIPFIFKGIPNMVYISSICKELTKYIE